MIGSSTCNSEGGGCWWYNSSVRKQLFAGAILTAIAVAIISPTFHSVEPWLNVWMPVCGSVSDWSHFKSCMAGHGVHVDERDLFVHTSRQEQKGVQPTTQGDTNGVPGKTQ